MIEILGNAGIIAKSPEDFENKLNELINSYEMRKEYGQKAKKRAALFTNKKMINNYDNIFKSLL